MKAKIESRPCSFGRMSVALKDFHLFGQWPQQPAHSLCGDVGTESDVHAQIRVPKQDPAGNALHVAPSALARMTSFVPNPLSPALGKPAPDSAVLFPGER